MLALDVGQEINYPHCAKDFILKAVPMDINCKVSLRTYPGQGFHSMPSRSLSKNP